MNIHYVAAIYQNIFSVDSIKMSGLHGSMYDLLFHYDDIDIDDILHISTYLMIKHNSEWSIKILAEFFWWTQFNSSKLFHWT